MRSVGLEDMVEQITSQPLDVLEARIHQLKAEMRVVSVRLYLVMVLVC